MEDILIGHGNSRYRVVKCGKKCSFGGPECMFGKDPDGICTAPSWWKRIHFNREYGLKTMDRCPEPVPRRTAREGFMSLRKKPSRTMRRELT